ncbi:N-acetylglucosamine kinase [Actinorhabdospora filicis]|uniref:N-acetylglucosamine kinase n=1 Tax=Actinorhabdospora filicis TaxID=1785913 RepID=A0A9W6SKP8_9ACTN|nr:BadF/BadG/BcrA/BcrD ATPase family protein [Actinorhabdospora filicis]GLZ78779.1 N-acetylglucosamine kinase [Actinorhabdospora filicis]
MRSDLVLGFDIGGTSTRALTATLTGERLATGTAPGGNPTSHGTDTALAHIAQAAAHTLTGIDPTRVAAVHIGLAGGEPLQHGPGKTALDTVFTTLGVPTTTPVTCGTDLIVAFAAGTSSPEGTIAIGGTGAVAGGVAGHELISRGDGYGWLLGDAGSGFWLGKRAVRATLEAIDGHAPIGPLAKAVLAETWNEPGEPTSRRLIDVVMRRPHMTLAAHARLVTTAATDGDPVAIALLEQAAAHLAATIISVRDTRERTPIVLAGSLLTAGTAVGTGVRDRLTRAFPDAPLLTGTDGVAAAAWLAARDLVDDPTALHKRLLG